jgi:hypothetical protein
MHAARIRRFHGAISTLLPYEKPPGLIDLQPGYAVRPEAGAVTDDTFIRGDFTRFFIETRPPRTPQMLASWLADNADFDKWWDPMIEPLRRVERGEAAAEEAGLDNPQGGGAGWWTPIGIIHAGDPGKAAAETRRLCQIWKAPLEQDLLAGVQAGLADGQRSGATVESVLEAMLAECGPLATALLERGVEIGRSARSGDDLVEQLYARCLVGEAPIEADAPMPAGLEPLDYTDDFYATILFAEQIPLAMAAFVFADGDPARAIPQAAMIGRDADSIATTVGSLAGGLCGERGLSREWVDTVCAVNREEIDIRGLADQLLTVEA